jgi:hypothetical protein
MNHEVPHGGSPRGFLHGVHGVLPEGSVTRFFRHEVLPSRGSSVTRFFRHGVLVPSRGSGSLTGFWFLHRVLVPSQGSGSFTGFFRGSGFTWFALLMDRHFGFSRNFPLRFCGKEDQAGGA